MTTITPDKLIRFALIGIVALALWIVMLQTAPSRLDEALDPAPIPEGDQHS